MGVAKELDMTWRLNNNNSVALRETAKVAFSPGIQHSHSSAFKTRRIMKNILQETSCV